MSRLSIKRYSIKIVFCDIKFLDELYNRNGPDRWCGPGISPQNWYCPGNVENQSGDEPYPFRNYRKGLKACNWGTKSRGKKTLFRFLHLFLMGNLNFAYLYIPSRSWCAIFTSEELQIPNKSVLSGFLFMFSVPLFLSLQLYGGMANFILYMQLGEPQWDASFLSYRWWVDDD